jgi:hypothetical protein
MSTDPPHPLLPSLTSITAVANKQRVKAKERQYMMRVITFPFMSNMEINRHEGRKGSKKVEMG